MKLQIRRLYKVVDQVRSVKSSELAKPLTFSIAAAVIRNPFAGVEQKDLSILGEEYSPVLGDLLADAAREGLGAPAEAFGKACLVGLDGETLHGSEIIHTKRYGDSLRRVSDGFAPVTAAEKCGPPGGSLDISMRFARESGTLAEMSLAHVQSYECIVPGAPLADEIVVISALADGQRLDWRR